MQDEAAAGPAVSPSLALVVPTKSMPASWTPVIEHVARSFIPTKQQEEVHEIAKSWSSCLRSSGIDCPNDAVPLGTPEWSRVQGIPIGVRNRTKEAVATLSS